MSVSLVKRFDTTTDGVRIVVGMDVWTNNLRRATVQRFAHEDNGNGWWITTDGVFDGSRMSTAHPVTGERTVTPAPTHSVFAGANSNEWFREFRRCAAVAARYSELKAAHIAARCNAVVIGAAGRRGRPAAVGAIEVRSYAHGVTVTYERMPAADDVNGLSEDQRWYYTVSTDNGAETEDAGYTRTKAEAAESARTARDDLAYRFAN